MQVITRYNHKKGRATVSLEQQLILTGRGGIDVYAEETFPIADAAAITDCQNKFYQQMSERIEAGRRNLNHLPAAIKRTGNKRKD